MFFNEVVGKKNKHKNRKAIWFEYMLMYCVWAKETKCPFGLTKWFRLSLYGGLSK
jgi:hypothetical protein